jgi:hypothetical protein
MVRRSALPEPVASGEIQPRAAKCGVCDGGPAFLCPSCPRRNGGKSDDEHGWNYLRRQWAKHPDMYACLRLDAELARAIAITHPSHPAFAELERRYQDNGMLLGRLRAEHRARIAEGAA